MQPWSFRSLPTSCQTQRSGRQRAEVVWRWEVRIRVVMIARPVTECLLRLPLPWERSHQIGRAIGNCRRARGQRLNGAPGYEWRIDRDSEWGPASVRHFCAFMCICRQVVMMRSRSLLVFCYIFYLIFLSLYITPILCISWAQLIFIFETHEFSWGCLGYEYVNYISI